MTMKRLIALAMACCMIFAFAACGHANDRDVQGEIDAVVNSEPGESQADPANPEGDEQNESPNLVVVPKPTATSDDVELYVVSPEFGTAYVVNGYGQRTKSYSLDADGDILDADGKYVVMAENVKAFEFINELSFGSRSYNVTLDAREEIVNSDSMLTQIIQHPATITVLLAADSDEFTNGVVAVKADNAAIAEIRANNNARIVAEGAFELSEGELAIQLSEEGTARIVVTAKAAGNTTIKARTLSGNASAECGLYVSDGEAQNIYATPEPGLTETINASENPMIHTHVYTASTVPPTATERGYTLYTCECGYSYRDNYTDPLGPSDPEPTPHVHEYHEVVVAPTETERGYTLHVCDCGDSYKDRFVDPIQP